MRSPTLRTRAALYVSAITAWGLGVALSKRDRRPDLGGGPERWFRDALRAVGAKLATITPAVAAQAAAVPEVHGRGDPGDCFLIATARVRRIPIVTRDHPMLRLSAAQPSYLAAIIC